MRRGAVIAGPRSRSARAWPPWFSAYRAARVTPSPNPQGSRTSGMRNRDEGAMRDFESTWATIRSCEGEEFSTVRLFAILTDQRIS